jgi:tetratricopeptide (TPR) repeat protein
MVACSTRKNNAGNRLFHNVTAKYNVLYNGNVALEKGITQLNENYEDNFWEILPIEPLEIEQDHIEVAGLEKETTNKTDFDIAEEKAVKSVQKHGMYIAGNEYNPQTDDAYFLLGKARYYSQRFVPALEAFDYTLKYNSQENLNDVLRIWKAKTQIRLQNEEQALSGLKMLLRKEKLDNAIKEQAHTAMAMGYMALDSTKQVIKQLRKATATEQDREQHARNLFILGQLYQSQNNKDTAVLSFKKVVDYGRVPKKYKIHALIALTQLDTISENIDAYAKALKKYTKDPLYDKYFDEIYYGLAQVAFEKGDETRALELLTKSVVEPKAKNYQKVLSYARLGDYYFDKSDFVTAGNYYDSLVPFIEHKNNKKMRRLLRKQESLEDVLQYEGVLAQNDSIMTLVKMNEDERKTYFNTYIEKLREADRIAAIQKENAERTYSGTGLPANNGSKAKAGGKWYFYNAQAVGFGKIEFEKVWGKRTLQDNWRWVQGGTIVDFEEGTQETLETEKANEENRYSPEYYISMMPVKQEEISEILRQTSEANYQLGLIYKEKFQEYPLAVNRLKRFLDENPVEKFKLPAQYHLYQSYEAMGDTKASVYKNKIISNYPDSRYAQLLTNQLVSHDGDSALSPEGHYEKVYCEFEYGHYQTVFDQCTEAVMTYEGEPIQPKFELLKAYAQHHLNGKDAFIEGLEFVVLNFPKTEEGIHAQNVLDRINGVVRTEKPKEQDKIAEPQEETKDVKPISEEEKKKRVLEMMKKQGPPPMERDNRK